MKVVLDTNQHIFRRLEVEGLQDYAVGLEGIDSRTCGETVRETVMGIFLCEVTHRRTEIEGIGGAVAQAVYELDNELLTARFHLRRLLLRRRHQ